MKTLPIKASATALSALIWAACVCSNRGDVIKGMGANAREILSGRKEIASLHCSLDSLNDTVEATEKKLEAAYEYRDKAQQERDDLMVDIYKDVMRLNGKYGRGDVHTHGIPAEDDF